MKGRFCSNKHHTPKLIPENNELINYVIEIQVSYTFKETKLQPINAK